MFLNKTKKYVSIDRYHVYILYIFKSFLILDLCGETHWEHLEQLQTVRRPAFFRFVDGERQLDVTCVLREQQHQEYGSV